MPEVYRRPGGHVNCRNKRGRKSMLGQKTLSLRLKDDSRLELERFDEIKLSLI
jgi:hypothetical protein